MKNKHVLQTCFWDIAILMMFLLAVCNINAIYTSIMLKVQIETNKHVDISFIAHDALQEWPSSQSNDWTAK